jgi:hypothetical protein
LAALQSGGGVKTQKLQLCKQGLLPITELIRRSELIQLLLK